MLEGQIVFSPCQASSIADFVTHADFSFGDDPRTKPAAMHESGSYGGWAREAGQDTGWVQYASIEEVRATGQYRVLTPEELVAEGDGFVSLHPLMGGLPVEEAWRSLRLIETEVMPRL